MCIGAGIVSHACVVSHHFAYTKPYGVPVYLCNDFARSAPAVQSHLYKGGGVTKPVLKRGAGGG